MDKSNDKPASAWARYLTKEQVLVRMASHTLFSDHAKRLGGEELGPSPGEMLAGALSACVAHNVGKRAQVKGYPLESVEVRTEYEVGFDKTEGPADSIAYLSEMTCRVELKGPLTGEQFAELKWVAENCPIGNTLRRGLSFKQEIVPAPKSP